MHSPVAKHWLKVACWFGVSQPLKYIKEKDEEYSNQGQHIFQYFLRSKLNNSIYK